MKKHWIVRMKCEVVKDVFVEDCTREQAESDPWDYAYDEVEIDMRDWEVESVHENE